jgi:hypothetical protein
LGMDRRILALARAVGLWLAEGDRKSAREVILPTTIPP